MKGLTPDGNEGTDECPICGRINAPGECDSCEHHFGSLWDGEIINSDLFDEFEKLWDKLTEIAQNLGLESSVKIKRLRKHLQLSKSCVSLLESAAEGESTTAVLLAKLDFEEGDRVCTGSMLSGEGVELYLDDKSECQALNELVRALLQALSQPESFTVVTRGSSPRRKIALTATWGNDDADSTVKLSPKTWRLIEAGAEHTRGTWSYYEGKRYHVTWHFQSGLVSINGEDGMECVKDLPVRELFVSESS